MTKLEESKVRLYSCDKCSFLCFPLPDMLKHVRKNHFKHMPYHIVEDTIEEIDRLFEDIMGEK